MKRLLIAVLALIMIASLCACGSNSDSTADQTVNTETFDKSYEYVGTLVSGDDFTATTDESGLSANWSNKDPDHSVDYPDVVELKDQTVNIGKDKVSDLKDKGFTLNTTENETVAPGKMIEVPVTIDEQNCTLYTEVNTSDEAVAIEDMTVGGFYVACDTFSPFSYNGLSEKSTLEDIMNQEGMEPNYVDMTTHGGTTLVYVRYNKVLPDDKVKTLIIGASYDGNDSKLIYVQYGKIENTEDPTEG